ncbi:hypothetical protein K9S39_39405 [Streptomyces halobius]|uniref:AbiEi antitoxin of type IV toxin-antitoxin system n=2 Tax=Streptomyces halobius TaxID=2879846 RepID=A0ABY4MK43_9ACTN|nr:hypothetical protein K9S39_39405 [Streptomyces halobius]
MTVADAAKPLLERIDEREQAITDQAELVRAQIEELTARLGEADEHLEHLRITRKTVLALADGPAHEPTLQPAPELPEHPAYQQIMAVFTDSDDPLRARDLCPALDLPIVPKNTEGIRSKLKRLVSRGILAEIEPGLFARPRP